MANQNGQKVTLVWKLKKENNSQKSEDNDKKEEFLKLMDNSVSSKTMEKIET